MFSILKFEMKKLFKSKLMYFLLPVLLVGSFFIASMEPDSNSYTPHDANPKLNTDDIHKKAYEISKAELKEKEENPMVSKSEIESLKSLIYNYEVNSVMLKSLESKDYKSYYENIIKYKENRIKQTVIGYGENDKKGDINDIKIYQLLSAKNLDLIEEGTSNQGFNCVRRLMNDKFIIMLMVFSIMISSPIFAVEVDNKTYKLLYTQGISKTKIFMGKFIFIVVINILVILFLLFSVFIYMSIKNGMGDINYVLRSFEGYKLSVMFMGTYILNEITIMFLIILCISALSCIVSIVANNVGVVLFINTTIMIAMYFLTASKYLLQLDFINIFEYLDVNKVVYGIPFYHDVGYNLPQHVVMENAYMYFPIIALVFIFTALMIFRKKMVK